MGKIISIDLGTTNSVGAICAGPSPHVLDSREGKPQTRSVVGLKKGKAKTASKSEEILVGDPALDNWPMAPKDTIISIKRLMGRGVADPEVQKVRKEALYEIVEPSDGTKDSVCVVMGGKQYTPIDISSMILRKVKEDAEYQLGEEVTHAVITVPAYFSQIQRDATRKASLKAGMKVIKILDEPTAAAIAFGMESGDGTPKTLLVFDLGGGTFDISVLMWAGNLFAPLTLEGDMWLGGDNLDQVLVDHVVRHVKKEYGVDPTTHMRFMAELKKAAQTTKERLSSARSANVIVTGILQDEDKNLIDVVLEVTRDEYERMILPLVAQYKACGCGQVNYKEDLKCVKCGEPLGNVRVNDGKTVKLVRKAMENVNLSPEQIDYVLMAGNATRVRLVQQAMEELFGKDKVSRKVHAKHSVALGAAIAATRIGNRVVCQAPDPLDPKLECGHVNDPDVTTCKKCGATLDFPEGDPEAGKDGGIQIGGIAPFHYGTQSAGDKFHVFIKKGEPFPTEDAQAQIFYTRMPNQRRISIPVYGGDDLENASRNDKQGEAFATLPRYLPQDTAVRIRLWLDSNGIFDLTAHLTDGTDLKPSIVKGEVDAKAIEVLDELEGKIEGKQGALSPKKQRELEEARDQVLVNLKEGKHNEALKEAERAKGIVDEAGREVESEALRTNAENWINYVQFILHQYSWALDPNQAYRLTNLAEQTKTALEGGNPEVVNQSVNELVNAVNQLPDIIRFFLGLMGAIDSRIRPIDPALAATLYDELREVENAVKVGKPSASVEIEAINGKVEKTLKDLETRAQRPFLCSNGHKVSAGARICPQCGEDTYLLGARAAGTTGSSGIRQTS